MMMMIGERNHPNPTIHVPPWTLLDDPTVDTSFPFAVTPVSVNLNGNADEYTPFDSHRYLPSNDVDSDPDDSGQDSDHFRMFEFKIRKCTRGRSHDWTECPYAHPGEKARRRDPRRYRYSGSVCPEFRKGNCEKGDACEFAHGVFECWLHPTRYRTQPCKDGLACRRRVCFFAHSPDELRVLGSDPGPGSYDGSPQRMKGLALELVSSPESPRMSNSNSPSRSLGSNSVKELMACMRELQLNKVKSMPSSWGFQMGGSGLGSPRLPVTRPGFCSLPATPTRVTTRKGIGSFDLWDQGGCEEEPVMERVESGRDLRAKMFEKLSRENPLDRANPGLKILGLEPGGSNIW
ncbi:zinc finger CCCH domain-containing protein 20-like [Actinidia eriantha]|uniref:zinc finger CCCH domain-containing protein 20-like n=1 Tax=Actinidia eriantha TaxID=165200 RepID=UPI002588B0D2|nr:zinc finger CCCH domain-containing protein 20-like [Actinidia eriantha]